MPTPWVETRRRTRAFLGGLLAELPRKNCWTIAEHAGDCDPHGMQHLLGRAVWDTDGVRDDLRDYVVDHLGDADAVLVVDETGDLKKGDQTVGVLRTRVRRHGLFHHLPQLQVEQSVEEALRSTGVDDRYQPLVVGPVGQ